jgi:hypothetical protein
MSLTRHLKSLDSPVRMYLERSFPILQLWQRGKPHAKEFSSILEFDDLPTCSLPTPAPNSDQGAIGHAVDYRLRYYFCAYDSHGTVAANGVSMLGGKAGAVGRKFLDHQNELVARLCPVGRQLNREDETSLNTNCVILAWFEQVYRSRRVSSEFDTLLRRSKVEGLISGVRSEMVQDISQLSSAFVADAQELFKSNSILNPTFEGSPDVGGADADMIVDKTLIEFKCTSKLDASELRKDALQLLGYVLLDYGGKFAVSDLLVYLPRQRFSWRMPIWKLVLAPEAVQEILKHGDTPKMEEVSEQLRERRLEFRKVTKSLQVRSCI